MLPPGFFGCPDRLEQEGGCQEQKRQALPCPAFNAFPDAARRIRDFSRDPGWQEGIQAWTSEEAYTSTRSPEGPPGLQDSLWPIAPVSQELSMRPWFLLLPIPASVIIFTPLEER